MKPYVILIGSASGIGKSTIASEISNKLNIKYLIETDFIREIVRGIIGPDYAPALHKSSYDAYTTLRDSFNYESEEKLIEAGFDVRNVEGKNTAWVVVDCHDVLVHVFTREEREHYNLEKIYMDVPTIDVEQFRDSK